jgi:signal transduction histidine kinase
MGMGLNICRSIIESHKGRLWVESQPGGRFIFRFTLPAAMNPTPISSTTTRPSAIP